MKKNGIIYENNLPTSTNGSWIQTVAYLLDYMTKTQEELISIISGTSQPINIIKVCEDINLPEVPPIVCLPTEEEVKVCKPHPIMLDKPRCKRPKKKDITKELLYRKCCGHWTKNNSNYINCKRRVDEFYLKIKEEKGLVLQSDITFKKIMCNN